MGHRKLLLQKNILYLLIVGQGKIDHQVFKVALLSDEVHAWEEKIFELRH